MLKYAKVKDEKTKQCFVGLDNPNDIYSEETTYDEEGNPHTITITYKEYYESIGMKKMKVEQAYSGFWYLEGYAPEKPAPTWEEIDNARKKYREEHIDDKTIARSRKTANGTWTEADEEAYLALDAEVTAWIEENLPYPEES